MTRRPAGDRTAVVWLTAQAVAFGVAVALLGIVANALFLAEYGSGWLPVTYLFIGVAGALVSGAIARAARSGELLRIAVTVLSGAAGLLVAAWAIAWAGGAWVSAPLLVLFPVLIQLGFVFIGGQAGRILDIAGIKAHFAQIVAGFPAGAVVGGLVAGPIVAWSGRTDHLLLATALAQGAFVGLVAITGRRYAAALAPGPDPVVARSSQPDTTRPPMRRLLSSRYVALIVGYQVLSAVGSQISDFLVYDRAAARYAAAAELAHFVARFTAIMNVISIAFLVIVAGPLLRRFGLRLGLAANPVVLTLFGVGLIGVTAGAGAGSLAVLGMVAMARIADVALTDGTTRTSTAATYQVIPLRDRLSVQAAVEGIAVPLAISLSGALILALNALSFAVEAMVIALTLVSAIWVIVGVLLYRQYGHGLVDALRRRRLLDDTAAAPGVGDETDVGRLLASPDEQDVALGLEIVAAASSPAVLGELDSLVADGRPSVRLAALGALASTGDASARRQLAREVSAAAAAPDPDLRRRAANALGVLEREDRAAEAHLLGDADLAVLIAALDAVRPGDDHAVEPVIDALGDARAAPAAAGALSRLGDTAVPRVAERLRSVGDGPVDPVIKRVVRATRGSAGGLDDVLVAHVAHPDREFGLLVLERLIHPEPAPVAVTAVLSEVLSADARHAAHILHARTALGGAERNAVLDGAAGDDVLDRALTDELELIQRRAVAAAMVRHGRDRLGPVILGVHGGDRQRDLAEEALAIILDHDERAVVSALLLAHLTDEERLARLPPRPSSGAADALRDLVVDADDEWRSPWLRACAIDAARRAGMLAAIDTSGVRDLGDALIDEALTAI